MINVLSWELEAALREAENRLFKILTRVHANDPLSRTDSIMELVYKECLLDKRRWSYYESSRMKPVAIGSALNLHHADVYTPIYLVDSSTWMTDSWAKNVKIMAKSIRPYLPLRGTKEDKGYEIYVKKHLSERLLDSDEMARRIIDTRMNDSGMYEPMYPEEFKCYAPRVCLLFANIFDKRRIFQLRPSSEGMSKMAYLTYCFATSSALIKRSYGSCDLETWNSLTDKKRNWLKESMVVRDSQLIVNRNTITNYNVIGKIKEIPNIYSPALFLMAA